MRQRLGQHFLRDGNVVKAIVEAAELKPEDVAIEIGPGKAVLTEPLASRVKKLVAVELDETLARHLTQRFAGSSKITIHREDFLKCNLDAFYPLEDRPVKVLGNLPYAVTSPIVEKVLAWSKWETAVFLVQREVGDRMRSEPGSKTFGILSLAVQLFADVENIMIVKPGAFAPPPEVTSAVIRLRRKPAAPLGESLIPAFFDLAHGAFAHRRKTIGNSLSFHSGIPKKTVDEWLKGQEINPGLRAETLGLPDYVRLAPKWADFRRQNNIDIGPGNVYNTAP